MCRKETTHLLTRSPSFWFLIKSSSAEPCMQDDKSLCVVGMTSATLVNYTE